MYEVIRLVNELRAAYHLPAYQVDSVLMDVAQAQASWSAENNYIGHSGPGGTSPNDRAQAAGYGAGANSFATENAAHGTASRNTPLLVVTMWQTDWGHLNALISPDYDHIGVGFAEAGGYSWYVMMVGWIGGESGSSVSDSQESFEEVVPYSPFVLSDPDEDGAIYHEVQYGQAAWTIAAYYEVELAELLALNNLSEDSILHPGDILLVRPPDTPISTRTSNLGTEIPVQTTILITPTTGISPTPTISVVTDDSARSCLSPIYLVIGSGLAVLTCIALVRTLMDNTEE